MKARVGFDESNPFIGENIMRSFLLTSYVVRPTPSPIFLPTPYSLLPTLRTIIVMSSDCGAPLVNSRI